jgi:hypothetical protein
MLAMVQPEILSTFPMDPSTALVDPLKATELLVLFLLTPIPLLSTPLDLLAVADAWNSLVLNVIRNPLAGDELGEE